MAGDVALALVGLALLLVGSRWLVAGAARLAARRGMSPVVVGAVILGFGTSLPELLVGVTAAAQGDPALGLGGIVGSNTANIGLVLGIAVLAAPIQADRSAWRRVPASVLAVGLFGCLLLTGGVIQRWEGGVLIAAMVGVTWWLLRDPAAANPAEGRTVEIASAEADADSEGLVDRWIDAAVQRLAPRSRGELWRKILGVVAIALGAQVSVDGFTGIAARLGIATGLVGLSLVALGTSLPELATAMVGIRRGQLMLTLGNVLGSNIFNSLAIGGIIVMVQPGGLGGEETGERTPGLGGEGTPWIAAGTMIGLTLLAVLFLATPRHQRQLERWEGAVLVAAYGVALPFILMS